MGSSSIVAGLRKRIQYSLTSVPISRTQVLLKQPPSAYLPVRPRKNKRLIKSRHLKVHPKREKKSLAPLKKRPTLKMMSIISFVPKDSVAVVVDY